MRKQRLTNPTNIRFSPVTHSRLKTLAERFGVTPTDLVRAATREKLKDWEAANRVVLYDSEVKT